MTTYNNVLDVFSYAAHTLANTLWSERALSIYSDYRCTNQPARLIYAVLNDAWTHAHACKRMEQLQGTLYMVNDSRKTAFLARYLFYPKAYIVDANI